MKIQKLILMAALLSLLLSACSLPGMARPTLTPTPMPTETPTFTPLPPTNTPLPPTQTPTQVPPSPTPLPPTEIPPSPTNTVPPTPQAQRITFEAGEVSATLSGSLTPYNVRTYILKASAGQTLNATLQPGDGSDTLTMRGVNKVVQVYSDQKATSWSGQLSASQDYYIEVRNTTGETARYTLQVTVPPLNPEPDTDTAQRIEFASGATSAEVSGQVPVGQVDVFVLKTLAKQKMAVNLEMQGGQAVLVIYGADGTVLLSSGAGATEFSGTLPKKQDYFIDVRNIGPGKARYLLQVAVTTPSTDDDDDDDADSSTQRITFATGGNSAEVSGQVKEGKVSRFVIQAEARQKMILDLQVQSGSAVLAVYGEDGTLLLSADAEDTQWSHKLPSAQDYYIEVHNTGDGKARFILQVALT